MLTQQIISLVFLLLSHECTAQRKFPVQQKILQRRNHIIRCCGKNSCSPVEKFVSIELPTTTTQLTTTTEGITTTTLPPTTTEPITVEFTTEVVIITETVTQAAVIPVTIFSPSTRSSTPRVTTIAAVSIAMKATDPRVITPKYKTVPTEYVFNAPVPTIPPCKLCPSCTNDITLFDAAVAAGVNGNIPGAVEIQHIGMKRYHIKKGHHLTFYDAYKFCNQHGAYLATIESKEEHLALAAFTSKLGMGGYIFVGAHKIGNCTYRWIDGKTMEYNFWQSGEPSQWSVENCAILYGGNGYDLPCYIAADYICEFPE